ncbi:MAG: exodeoxyribonuclease VII large subunit [Clostridiales Family XIII bacterium]|jgi:exodeoxyribonuclease VII large subunit|nr:exodeoxyribonuclease VII large subunit [Clostridiales Family XIII bacterium]
MAPNPIKVSQLNGYIKRVLQSDPILGNVSVVGEISNFKFHGNGHAYFSLKDDQAKVNCFLPSNILEGLRFEPGDGIEVVVVGYVNVYEKGGTYSLNVRDITVRGAGNLALAFEKLKEKLASEGLFDRQYKKPLPAFPKSIAIVTSATGAAVEDMVKIVTCRNNYVNIYIYPTLVQGPEAAGQIAEGIVRINRARPDIDLIIIGRGGGSVEELWAFNEERLARAVFASEIPVISAVGHETDVTITDFVADVRAETPTAAAQMAVPEIEAVRADIEALASELAASLADRVERLSLRVNACNIGGLRAAAIQRIDCARTEALHLRKELDGHMRTRVLEKRHMAERRAEELRALNPLAILARGYAVLTDADGRMICSAKKLTKGMAARAILKDGRAELTVGDVEHRPTIAKNGEQEIEA